MVINNASVVTDGKAGPRFDVADIFRDHGEEYGNHHVLTSAEQKVIAAITSCRTAALGGHMYTCDACDYDVPMYNSCRNRHCPKCQALSQAKWIEERKERILPTHYFPCGLYHAEQLRSLVLCNRRALFNLLFDAAANTLLDLGKDPKHLGAHLGVTAVLHTWTRTLQFHPHVHCLVTGGGLSVSQEQWVSTRVDYLFAVQVMSSLFRGKLLSGLRRLYDKGKLRFGGQCAHLDQPEAFAHLMRELYDQPWVVYCKKPFAGAQQVFDYLGRYTHRVGISNYRLLDVTNNHVTFSTKDGGTETVSPHEFIRRFLLHILPRGLQKIRHFGLMASSNVHTKLEKARELLLPEGSNAAPITEDVSQPEAGQQPLEDWQLTSRR